MKLRMQINHLLFINTARAESCSNVAYYTRIALKQIINGAQNIADLRHTVVILSDSFSCTCILHIAMRL